MSGITGWIKGTGEYIIREITTQDPVLKHLVVGTKYMENLVGGTISIPCKCAYGEFYFDVYKGGDFTSPYIYLISDDMDILLTAGYYFRFGTNESLQFKKITAGATANLFESGAGLIAHSTWYGIKITRTKDGEFYAYARGGAYGANWVLIVPTGGPGTNPVTNNDHKTSEHFGLDFDADDCIANIRITEGVEQ